MITLIPKGVEIAPYYMKAELELQPWLDINGKIASDAPRDIKEMYKDLINEVKDAQNETEEVIF